MPNAMIKCKTQLVKVEKENENKHIRRKNTTLHKADRAPLGKAETVWERLSKVRRTASNEDNVATASKSKTTIRAKSAHRMQASRGSSVNRGALCGSNQGYNSLNALGYTPSTLYINPHAMQSKKPLSTQNYSNKREKLNERKPTKKALRPGHTPYDNVVVEEIPYCGLTKNVVEVLTARSLCNSKSSSDESKNTNSLRSKSCHSAECQTECNTRSHTHPKIVINQHSHSQSINPVNSHICSQSDSIRANSSYNSPTHSQHASSHSPIHQKTHSAPHSPIPSQNHSPMHSPVHSPKYSPTHNRAHSSNQSPLRSPKYSPTHNRNHSPLHSPKYSPTYNQAHSSTHSTLHSPEHSPTHRQTNSQTQGVLGSQSRSTHLSKIGLNLTDIRPPHQLDHTSSISQNSIDLYQVPPLIPVPTRDSLNSSIKIQNNFESLLQKKKHTMAPDEIKLIKRVVKSDERYRQLHQSDEKLFKDILKTQLKDILQQGTIVKSALHKLGDSESESAVAIAPSISQMEKSVAFSEVPDKQQVNVVFKNVPSLEKEIIILRALGEKLEATLKRTKSHRTLHISERRSTGTSMVQLREIKMEHSLLTVEHNATMSVRVMGIRRCIGIVKEFNIARKTIIELKQESDRHFYLPLGGQRGELKRTSFRKLKQNPDVLMRYLKPKNAFVPFNVLEQDPIFFKSFLLNINKSPHMLHSSANALSDVMKCTLEEESDESYQNLCLHEGGDSSAPAITSLRDHFEQFSANTRNNLDDVSFPNENIVYPKRDKETSKRLTTHRARVTFDDQIYAKENKSPVTRYVDKKVQAVEQLPKATTPPPPPTPPRTPPPTIHPKQMGRTRRRSVTPMPLYKYVEPKNNLLKTILVGSIQISVFLLLIMAITYPDLKC